MNIEYQFDYDNEGRLTAIRYPQSETYDGHEVSDRLAYTYDSMGLPDHLTSSLNNYENIVRDIVTSATYGPADEMREMRFGDVGQNVETRTYDAVMQLTRIQNSVVDLRYAYPVAQNDGRIQAYTEKLGNAAEVTYNFSYDSLGRLATASSAALNFGTQYVYDGFGNLTARQNLPGYLYGGGYQVSVNSATNSVGQTDANGNTTYLPGTEPRYQYPVWDQLNRMTSTGTNGEQYGYDANNKRVWRQDADGNQTILFYGPDGRLLTTHALTLSVDETTGAISLAVSGPQSWRVYFAGRLILGPGGWVTTDRLGSVRARSTDPPPYMYNYPINASYSTFFAYYPHGEERGATDNGREKFGTYMRDITGLDYADQRYYNSASGRFLSPDPYMAATGSVNNPADPQSWNRYAYVLNDPVNFTDSQGLFAAYFAIDGGGGWGGWGWLPDLVRFSPTFLYLPDTTAMARFDREPFVGGGPSAAPSGIAAAQRGLGVISAGGFRSKPDCQGFFGALLGKTGLDLTADGLMGATAAAAADAQSHGYVYDGPSSNTALDAGQFPNAATAGIKSVGDLFASSPGLQALSQYNGSAIWIRADDWNGIMSPYGGATPNGYELGTLLHELIHKNAVGGGFNHDEMKDALRAIGRNPSDFSGQNGISRELGIICF